MEPPGCPRGSAKRERESPSPEEKEAKEILPYIIDKPGEYTMQIDWSTCAFSDYVTTAVVHQGVTCACFALSSTEVSRCAINKARNFEDTVPPLSASHVLVNNHGRACTGYPITCAFEMIKKVGVCEESSMPFEGFYPEVSHVVPCRRHYIHRWYHLEDDEDSILSALAHGTLSADILVPFSFDDIYKKGLVDLKAIERNGDGIPHSVSIVGAGFLTEKDGTITNVWKMKNSAGDTFGDKGYFYTIRNSSKLVNDYVSLKPMIPIYCREGEEGLYPTVVMVQDLDLDTQMSVYLNDTRYDIIMLLYDTRYRHLQNVLDIFEEVCQVYIHDKHDCICAKVDVTKRWTDCERFGVKKSNGLKTKPVLVTYKYENQGIPRDLLKGGILDFRKRGTAADFNTMASFLLNSVGCSCLV